MKIEIVEFYPKKKITNKRRVEGTLHIYIIDLGIDIRGIFVKICKNSWWFRLPHSFAFDLETKERAVFPVFMFTDLEKQKSFFEAVRTQGKAFIDDYLEKIKIQPPKAPNAV